MEFKVLPERPPNELEVAFGERFRAKVKIPSPLALVAVATITLAAWCAWLVLP